VSLPCGTLQLTSRRLCSRARTTLSSARRDVGSIRAGGTPLGDAVSRRRNASAVAVSVSSSVSGVPVATTRPPARPASGPMSTTQSARHTTAKSCSTTKTLAPA
jgi:hypothetical protein